MMSNHGTLTFGADLDGALRATELLEWACTVYWRAQAIGTPRVLDADQRQAVIEAAVQRRYGTTHAADGGGAADRGDPQHDDSESE
jgi:L-fuculose-phosphate aldolase